MPLFQIPPYESTERNYPVKCKIYDCRKAYKWTLKELALVGVPFSTLWRLERNQGTTLSNAYKVASAFQLTIYELWNIPQSGAATGLDRKNLYWSGELRLQRSWRLHDLAELSGVSKTTLWQIEKGHVPSLKNAVKIADALELSVYQIWKH